MVSIEEYRQHIQRLLSEHAQLVWDSRIRAELIFDQQRVGSPVPIGEGDSLPISVYRLA
ncbi:MAG: hypothetical protein KME30_17900 [Iphinoe sp. HA4291-MV1]|jgi:hypothetical protein|nr:hypothetical protein [Iphinoe sp. HA4291-MV1]